MQPKNWYLIYKTLGYTLINYIYIYKNYCQNILIFVQGTINQHAPCNSLLKFQTTSVLPTSYMKDFKYTILLPCHFMFKERDILDVSHSIRQRMVEANRMVDGKKITTRITRKGRCMVFLCFSKGNLLLIYHLRTVHSFQCTVFIRLCFRFRGKMKIVTSKISEKRKQPIKA